MEMNLSYFFEELRQDSYLAETDFDRIFSKDETKPLNDWLKLFLDWREKEADSSLEPQYKKAYLVSEVQLEN